jgi:hypothetical protein
MAMETITDAEAFLFFLAEEVKNGGRDKSPEELLQSWRAGHAEAIEDIRRGMQDLEAGRFRPFEEVDVEIRKKFGFSPKTR